MTSTFPECVPELSDGVVRLRAHATADIDRIVEQCTDPEFLRWTTAPRPYSREHAQEFLATIAAAWGEPDGHRYWAIERVDDAGRFAGTIDLRQRGQGGAEVGFGLHPDARGLGLMSRSLRLACRWWFDANDGRRIVWFARAGNEASWRVARACGFARHGDLPEYLPHPDDGLVDAWVASLGVDDELTGSEAP